VIRRQFLNHRLACSRGHHGHSILRSKPFTVITYAIDPENGILTQKATAPLPESMVYASTEASGRFLLTASYDGDKIAVMPITEAGLVSSEAIQIAPTGRNAHCVRADLSNKFIYVTNLGGSQILQYRFDSRTGALTPNDPPLVKSRPDNGPRHMTLSPDNKYLYVVHQLTGNIAQFSIDQTKGTLTEVGYTGSVPAESGLPPGHARVTADPKATPGSNPLPTIADDKPGIRAADIQVTPNGKYLYASERTTSKIALLSVAPISGKPTYVRNYPTETQPRGIKIDPMGKYLVVSGEKSDRLAVYKINQTDGDLVLVGRYPVGKDANWIEIVDVP